MFSRTYIHTISAGVVPATSRWVVIPIEKQVLGISISTHTYIHTYMEVARRWARYQRRGDESWCSCTAACSQSLQATLLVNMICKTSSETVQSYMHISDHSYNSTSRILQGLLMSAFRIRLLPNTHTYILRCISKSYQRKPSFKVDSQQSRRGMDRIFRY